MTLSPGTYNVKVAGHSNSSVGAYSLVGSVIQPLVKKP